MELKVTKEYSDIVNLLESLEEKIETEITNTQDEFAKKYELDITREILDYATDFLRMKINFLLKDAIKDFDIFNIIIDCTEIALNMNEMEALISRVSRQMKDSLPSNTDPSDVQIINKKYLRKIICRIPTRWTTPVVQQFLERFKKTLHQLGVSVN